MLNYSSQKSVVRRAYVSDLILAVEVCCHKVQGMTEAFTDHCSAVHYKVKEYL